MSRSLYWRIPHRRSHKIKSYKLVKVLDFCLELFRYDKEIPLYDTDVLFYISATIYMYGHDTKEANKDIETIQEMIEAIEKHGEIELFYEY